MTVRVVGFDRRCWRCGRTVTCISGLCPYTRRMDYHPKQRKVETAQHPDRPVADRFALIHDANLRYRRFACGGQPICRQRTLQARIRVRIVSMRAGQYPPGMWNPPAMPLCPFGWLKAG